MGHAHGRAPHDLCIGAVTRLECARGHRRGDTRDVLLSERPPEAVLWDLLRGALSTRALALACELKVADALAAGPRYVRDLAPELGADADVLYRLLRALA